MNQLFIAPIVLLAFVGLTACSGTPSVGRTTNVGGSSSNGGAPGSSSTGEPTSSDGNASTGGSTNTKLVETFVTAGYVHTCAVLSDSSVRCWGNNESGELGNSTTTNSLVPVTVSGITNAVSVAAGDGFTCALLNSGSVQCWGLNYGNLGNGITANSLVPVTVSGITNATALAAGYSHSCAVLSSGKVQCWGDNTYGELGNGTTTINLLFAPVTVSGITNAIAVAAGGSHTCALLSGGTIQCWGDNGFGELGNCTTSGPELHVMASVSNAVAVAAGDEYTCALLSGGTIQCWGNNAYGHLGNGASIDKSPCPVTVSGITTAVAVSASTLQNCAVLSGGKVQCWGDNTYGELGNGTTTSSSVPVTVSGF